MVPAYATVFLPYGILLKAATSVWRSYSKEISVGGWLHVRCRLAVALRGSKERGAGLGEWRVDVDSLVSPTHYYKNVCS